MFCQQGSTNCHNWHIPGGNFLLIAKIVKWSIRICGLCGGGGLLYEGRSRRGGSLPRFRVECRVCVSVCLGVCVCVYVHMCEWVSVKEKRRKKSLINWLLPSKSTSKVYRNHDLSDLSNTLYGVPVSPRAVPCISYKAGGRRLHVHVWLYKRKERSSFTSR